MRKKSAMAIIERRIVLTQQKSTKARDAGDEVSMYRHNTALHELWKVQSLLEALR